MTTTAAIDICNRALSHVGRTTKPIAAIDGSDTSIEARQCAMWYDACRQEVLEMQDWSFARRRATLSLHADAPPDEWGYRYRVPADWIAGRGLWNALSTLPPTRAAFGLPGNWSGFYGDLSDEIAWQMEVSLDGTENTILTNQPEAIMTYTRDVEIVALFTPLFVNVLSHYLASKIAFAVTGKLQYEQKELQAVSTAMGIGAASDANQGVAQAGRDAHSVRSRW